MKTLSRFFNIFVIANILVGLALSIQPVLQAHADGGAWQTIGTAGFSTGIAQYTSLAIDADNTPYVAYSDGNNSSKANVMKFDGSSWTNVGAAGFSAGTTAYTSLAIDSSGTPYLAYQDGANTNKATVMKFDGSGWINVGTAGFSAGAATFTSLAIDASGTPYVAYSDGSVSNKATVMKFTGSGLTGWEVIGSTGFSAGTAQYTSLAIDESGTLYVAYRDVFNSNKATVMNFSGDRWTNVGAAGFSAGGAYYTSLAFDGNTPYVAYQDAANGNKASVMELSGDSWVQVGLAGFSAGTAINPSIAIDGSGTPYVAYRDLATSNKATAMKFDGSSWSNVGGSPGFSTGQAYTPALAINASGEPYVAYQDYSKSAKATVMKYVFRSEMDVKGNGISIADGDTTPDIADHTDFGGLEIEADSVDRTFTIENSGDAALILSGDPQISISGANAADFTIIEQPISPVAILNGSTTFTVHFDPSTAGRKSATLSIANNDVDENPYTFNIQGTGLGMELLSNGGFEIYEVGSKIPTGWVASAFTRNDGKNLSDKRDGETSVRIYGLTGIFRTLSQTINRRGVGGEPLTLSYSAKGNSTIYSGLCQVRVSFYRRTILAGKKSLECPRDKTYSWKKMTLDFTSPVAYDKVIVEIVDSRAGGTILFDGVSLLAND